MHLQRTATMQSDDLVVRRTVRLNHRMRPNLFLIERLRNDGRGRALWNSRGRGCHRHPPFPERLFSPGDAVWHLRPVLGRDRSSREQSTLFPKDSSHSDFVLENGAPRWFSEEAVATTPPAARRQSGPELRSPKTALQTVPEMATKARHRRSKITGGAVRPRSPRLCRQTSLAEGSSARFGSCRSNASNASCPSIRAKGAPKQKCAACPKGEVLVLLAAEIEIVRIWETIRIPVCRRHHRHHRLPFRITMPPVRYLRGKACGYVGSGLS